MLKLNIFTRSLLQKISVAITNLNGETIRETENNTKSSYRNKNDIFTINMLNSLSYINFYNQQKQFKSFNKFKKKKKQDILVYTTSFLITYAFKNRII